MKKRSKRFEDNDAMPTFEGIEVGERVELSKEELVKSAVVALKKYSSQVNIDECINKILWK